MWNKKKRDYRPLSEGNIRRLVKKVLQKLLKQVRSTNTARCEASTAVKTQVEVFWIVTPSSFAAGYQGACCHPEDRGSKVLRNVGRLPYHNPERLHMN
jgi:hypothetical protein